MGRKKIERVEVKCTVCPNTWMDKADPKKRKACCSHECSEKLRAMRQSATKQAKSTVNVMTTKPCEICGTEFETRLHRSSRTCSNKCRVKVDTEKRKASHKRTMQERYGVDSPAQLDSVKEKMRQTQIEKHGSWEAARAVSNESKKRTMLARYGYEHAHQVKEFKDKAVANTDYKKVAASLKKSNLEKYGVEHAMQVPEIAAKSQKEKAARQPQIYRDIRTMEWWQEYYYDKKLSLSALQRKFGISEGTIGRAAAELGIQIRPTVSVSAPEIIIREKLDEIGIKYETNVKGLLNGNYEIDVWLPSHRIGIELHGVYWHSDAVKQGMVLTDMHHNKYVWAKEKDITLLQFWDYEVINNEQKCVDTILECLGMKELDSEFAYTDEIVTDNRLALDRYMECYDQIEVLPPKEWAVKDFSVLVPIEEDNTSIRIWDAGYTRWQRKSPT